MSTTAVSRDAFETAMQAYMRQEFADAMAGWRPLADAGDAESQAWVGALYANGEGLARVGVDADPGEALRWYRLAAEQGHVTSQNNLGAMLYEGKVVGRDPEAAAAWFRRAAEQGDPYAACNLGLLYGEGQGVPEDPRQAAYWYHHAASRGHPGAQAKLGYLFSVGKGVARDRVWAFAWLRVASQHGIGSALKELEKIVGEMSSDEKQLGQDRVTQIARGEPGDLPPAPDTPTEH